MNSKANSQIFCIPNLCFNRAFASISVSPYEVSFVARQSRHQFLLPFAADLAVAAQGGERVRVAGGPGVATNSSFSASEHLSIPVKGCSSNTEEPQLECQPWGPPSSFPAAVLTVGSHVRQRPNRHSNPSARLVWSCSAAGTPQNPAGIGGRKCLESRFRRHKLKRGRPNENCRIRDRSNWDCWFEWDIDLEIVSETARINYS